MTHLAGKASNRRFYATFRLKKLYDKFDFHQIFVIQTSKNHRLLLILRQNLCMTSLD